MRTWISCHRSLLASWVLYAGSINMTNAVDSLNVENIVEGSRCATALAFHAGIPEPLVLRFEECGGSLPPGGSLWREEYQGGSGSRSEIDPSRSSLQDPTYARSLASSRSTELRICSRYLSWRVVARRWNFALAFGAVSKDTSTSTLVEGEDIRERL